MRARGLWQATALGAKQSHMARRSGSGHLAAWPHAHRSAPAAVARPRTTSEAEAAVALE